jgi:hypothetical protein
MFKKPKPGLRRRPKRIVIFLIGLLFLILSIVLSGVSSAIAVGIGGSCFILWGELSWRERSLGSPTISFNDLAETSDFVLFLRPFTRDFHGNYGGGDYTSEQVIVSALATIGKVVAIGRPGEKLSPVGASRLYVDSASWQEVVLDLMRRARAVVIRPGAGQGLFWEVKAAVNSIDADKMLIALGHGRMPLRRTLDYYYYLDFRASVATLLRDLPDDPGDALFIAFDSAWSAKPLRSPASWLRRWAWAESVLVDAMRPFCTRLGVRPKKMSYLSCGLIYLLPSLLSCIFAQIIIEILRPADTYIWPPLLETVKEKPSKALF